MNIAKTLLKSVSVILLAVVITAAYMPIRSEASETDSAAESSAQAESQSENQATESTANEDASSGSADSESSSKSVKTQSQASQKSVTTSSTTSTKYAGLKIMLDAGHAGKYNKYYKLNYYESQMTWGLTNYLKKYLSQYPGIHVGMTKTSLNNDPGVYARGLKAKGYDLFLSIHSNSSSSHKTDYPLTIVSSKYKTRLYRMAQPLGKKLAKQIKTTMSTSQDYQVWVKRQSDGQDWYGVIRGAAKVNVPAIIVEHSFHSNASKAKWLKSSSNQAKMAKAEAAVIADYYGINKDGTLDKPGTPTNVKAATASPTSIKVTFTGTSGVVGYGIYRATSKNGTYKWIGTTKYNSYTDKNLATNKTYYYKVRAYRQNDTMRKYGNYSSTYGSAKTRPTKTSITKITAGKGKLTLQWKKVTGASVYQIYRSTSKNGTYKWVKSVKSNTLTWTNTNLKRKKTYYYKVRAYTLSNGVKVKADFSAVKSKKTK